MYAHYSQVSFKYAGNYEGFGGIGIYDNNEKLVGVISGDCGMFLSPEEVSIIERHSGWNDLSDTIKGDE